MVRKGYVHKYVPFSIKLAIEMAVDIHKEEINVFDSIIGSVQGSENLDAVKGISDRRRDYVLGLQEFKEEEEKKKDKEMKDRLKKLPKVIDIKTGKMAEPKKEKTKEKKGPRKFRTRSQVKIEKIKGGES